MDDWDFKETDPNIAFRWWMPKSQRADAKRKWIDEQIRPMEDIREFEQKVLYNESKNNRN